MSKQNIKQHTWVAPRAMGVSGILWSDRTVEPDLNHATGGYAEEPACRQAGAATRRGLARGEFFFATFFCLPDKRKLEWRDKENGGYPKKPRQRVGVVLRLEG